MEPTAVLRIAVMHRQELLAAGLAAIFVRQPGIDVVEAAGAVDVLLADLDTALRLLAGAPGRTLPRIVVVAQQATQAELRGALRQGAIGYLLADRPAAEIVDAVHKARRGQRHLSEPLTQLLLEDMLGERLTPREGDVLRLAAAGLANKVIASRLEIELGTVKCHMRSILDKLDADNRTEAVLIAGRRGLLSGAAQPLSALPRMLPSGPPQSGLLRASRRTSQRSAAM